MRIATVFFSILILASVAFGVGGKASILVEGITCAGCASAIEEQFKKHPEVKNIDISISKGEVFLTFSEGKKLSREAIQTAIEKAGYKVRAIQGI
ncbi:MAG: heavy-metal-associated domain-containing protein [Bdellovibrionales bacterium]|nr:heavy-metal-associated domain-containing protein [Bdellovibrionales bacterium]